MHQDPYAHVRRTSTPDPALAAAWDAQDPLAGFRERFALPPDIVYLDGMSLGPLTHQAAENLRQAAEQEWGRGLIRSWNDADWIRAPERIGARIAPLIGAAADEVLAADSTSVNWFKVLSAALRLKPGRRVLLVDEHSFPTNLYVAEGLAAQLGDVRIRRASRETLLDALDHDVAAVALTHADYRTAELYDMAAITRAAHDAGALAVWDLCHSAGATPLQLDELEVDLAVGCGYKYLNGGPGAPAYLYVSRRWLEAASQPITGWLGHAAPFEFQPSYQPAPGVKRMQSGTPSILALAALEGALQAWEDVDLQRVRLKTAALGEAFLNSVRAPLESGALELASPRDPDRRGGHLALRHPQAYSIVQAMIAEGFIGDFRAPDLMRWGMTPLYVSFTDVVRAGRRLGEILDSQRYRDPAFAQRRAVT